MRVIFMGTPEFAVPALEKLVEYHEVCCVVSQPDKPKGRGKKLIPTPIKQCALQHGIAVIQPDSIKVNSVIDEIIGYAADVIIVAAYGQILPAALLRCCKYGCINIHASLLPKYRGAAPIQRCIMDGCRETGVTIMFMEEKLDTGDMLMKKKILIKPEDNYAVVHDKLAYLGAEMIIETLDNLENNTAVKIKQDDAEATYAHMIKKDTCRIDFTKTAKTIINQIRALDPLPGAFTFYKNELLKIWCAEKTENICDNADCGEIIDCNNGIEVKVADGTILVTQLQGKNGKRMLSSDYLRGHSVEKGVKLGLEEL